MGFSVNKKISQGLENCDQSIALASKQALQGKSWNFRRVYILKDNQSHYHKISLNWFERLWLRMTCKKLDSVINKFNSRKDFYLVSNEKLTELANLKIKNKSPKVKQEDVETPKEKNKVGLEENQEALDSLPISFFEKITPDNIDQILNTRRDRWGEKNMVHFFGVHKYNWEDRIHYGIIFQFPNKYSKELRSWISHGFDVKDGKFQTEDRSEKGEKLAFNNFGEYLKYLAKGNFYQGNSFRANYYYFDLADGRQVKISRDEILKNK